MAFYRYLLLSLALPYWLARCLIAVAWKRESRDDLDQRLGGGAPPGVARGPVIWLHGASVGELAAARPLAEALLARDPQAEPDRHRQHAHRPRRRRPLGRSAGDGAAGAARRPLGAARFLAAWQPAALIQIENEIWPNRMAMAQARRMPVLAASARLSERSAASGAASRGWPARSSG